MRTRNTAYPLEFGQQIVELVHAERKPSELAKDRVFVEHAFARLSQVGGKNHPLYWA